MLYENEELRLKTININAEIERGKYKLKFNSFQMKSNVVVSHGGCF